LATQVQNLAALHAKAEEYFKRFPGVVGVGYGFKEVKGAPIEQLAFRVYVKAKRPLDELGADEVIPAEFEGVPTDVLLVRSATPVHCQDMSYHSPLISGISLSGFRQDSSGNYDSGTLGFFATLNGVSGPENVVLVSNNHVLAANGGSVGSTVYQPEYREVSGVVNIVLDADKRHPIGKIHNLGREGNHSFAYPTEAAQDYFVDCATAKLDICISSWCNTNCGISYKNEVRQLNINGNSKIADIARVQQTDVNAAGPSGYVVYKVGRRTSRTKGKIIDTNVPLLTGGERAIEILATEPDCDGILRFVEEGDSGSALINEQNQLIGLVFAKDNVDPTRAFACHIHPVLDLLQITALTVANPPVGPAGQARTDMEGLLVDGTNHTSYLRERFLATPKGAEAHARILEHREEVVGLVNHRRAVTVAWHKHQGPLFLSHFINNARNPNHLIPFKLNGITREALLRRMAAVLTEHGSAALGACIAEYYDEVMSFIDEFDDLHQFVERFEPALIHA